MRRRRGRKAKSEWFAVVAIAFGTGLILALFCSVKFALFVAAVALICLGITFRC